MGGAEQTNGGGLGRRFTGVVDGDINRVVSAIDIATPTCARFHELRWDCRGVGRECRVKTGKVKFKGWG